MHLTWYEDKVLDANGLTRSQNVINDSAYNGTSWSEPAIISRSAASTQPSGRAVADTLLLSTKYSLGTNDPQAIQDLKRLF